MARGDREYQRLAADLGVHKATVSKWVQGIGVPDPEQIPELARLAGLSVPAVAIAALATRDVIATGGLATLIAEGSETIDAVDAYLTLGGLRIIYNKNR